MSFRSREEGVSLCWRKCVTVVTAGMDQPTHGCSATKCLTFLRSFRIPSISMQTFTKIQKSNLVSAVCEVIIRVVCSQCKIYFVFYINKYTVLLRITATQS